MKNKLLILALSVLFLTSCESKTVKSSNVQHKVTDSVEVLYFWGNESQNSYGISHSDGKCYYCGKDPNFDLFKQTMLEYLNSCGLLKNDTIRVEATVSGRVYKFDPKYKNK